MDITPHQFFSLTKGTEYLIAVLFLALFTVLWAFLFKGSSKQD